MTSIAGEIIDWWQDKSQNGGNNIPFPALKGLGNVSTAPRPPEGESERKNRIFSMINTWKKGLTLKKRGSTTWISC